MSINSRGIPTFLITHIASSKGIQSLTQASKALFHSTFIKKQLKFNSLQMASQNYSTYLSLCSLLCASMLALISAATVPVNVNANEGKILLSVLSSFKAGNSRAKLDASWKSNLPCNKWGGVSCDSNGHVIGLDLRGRGLQGKLSEDIGKLTYLQSLELGLNSLSGSIPASVGNLKSLKTLDFNMNQISGSLPPSIGNLKSLQELILGYNKLTGSIPSTFGGLQSIIRMYINNNNLTGTLPSSLGALTKLFDLELSYNSITGTIPASLSSMSSLQRLHLRNNDLYGTIPPQLAKLNLINLLLSGNQLSGSIPDGFGTMYTLQVMSLSGNYFRGTIPQSVNSLPHLAGRSFGLNCLSYPDGWRGASDKQRPATKCKDFCLANSASGPCGGNGACALKNGIPTCICSSGFALGKSPKTCVATSVQNQ